MHGAEGPLLVAPPEFGAGEERGRFEGGTVLVMAGLPLATLRWSGPLRAIPSSARSAARRSHWDCPSVGVAALRPLSVLGYLIAEA
jgi:hypothetical protein